MTEIASKTQVTQAELAHLGEGVVAYLREIASGTRLWALFAANGQPILLSDERDRALAGAFENHLTPVAIH